MEEKIGMLCHHIANQEIREPQPTQPTTPAMGTMHIGAERIRHPDHGVRNQGPQQPSINTGAEADQQGMTGVDVAGEKERDRHRQAYVAKTSRQASRARVSGTSEMESKTNAKSRQESAASATTHKSALKDTRTQQPNGTQQPAARRRSPK